MVDSGWEMVENVGEWRCKKGIDVPSHHWYVSLSQRPEEEKMESALFSLPLSPDRLHPSCPSPQALPVPANHSVRQK